MRLLVDKDVPVGMRDGVVLRADVYRPDGPEPVPVLVQRTPYDKENPTLRNMSLDVLRAARAGYAVIVQDVRGRYASEGSFVPFANEGPDGFDTLAWASAQPWSSGVAGMVGASYVGATQWLAAMEQPPALRAIAPHLTASGYRDGWAFRGGAFELGFNVLWAEGSLAIGELLRRGAPVGPQLARVDAIAERYEQPPSLPEWVSEVGRVDHGRVTVRALNIGGWFDLFLEGTIDNFRAQDGARLIVGPWSHGNATGAFAERLFGSLAPADAADLTGEQLRWFDHHLRGGPAAGAPVRIFVMGPNEWRELDDWPSGGDVLFLGAGRLGDAPGEGVDALRHDPRDPVPTVGGATFLPGGPVAANAGPRDQRVLDARSDILRYATEPLERAVEVIGTVELVLVASSTARSADFTAKLIDVHPDGRAELITDGVVRAPLNGVAELRVRVGSTAWRFGAGHRIRLDIAGSNFPRFDRNPTAGTHAVHPGSRLVLPMKEI